MTQLTSAPGTQLPKGDGDTAAPGWGFLASRRWAGYGALFLVFTLVCIWLGNWQFERRAEARAEITRIDANYDAPAIPLTQALPTHDFFDEDDLKWQTVEARGSYLGDPFLARNRPGPDGGVGSNLIQPFQLEDGSVWFVDRGWVQIAGTDQFDAARLPAAPRGEVTVQARLRASEPSIDGRSASGRSVPSIDLAWLSTQVGAPSYTGAYGQLITESPEGEHGILPARPVRDEGPHLSYALQWYVFILIAAIGVAYAARQEYRSLNAQSESVRREDDRKARRSARRGPSDADIEDALLDR